MGTLNRDEITKEAARIEENATYGAETQFEYSKRWRRVDRILAGIAAVGAGVSGIGSLAELFGPTTAGVIALLSAAVGAVAASLNAPQTKERAAGAANAYKALQQNARVLKNIDLQTLTDEEARTQLQQLIDRQQELNATSEVPSSKAWKKARKQVESGSQAHEVDK
jgi:hypothetical protein